MKHTKYDYVKTCIEAGMPVRLTSEAGCGKTTMCIQVATELELDFYTVSCTKQMSVNALIGFISINGVYIPTQLRKAFESGGLFLLDELDAADPNVLLVLNTIENGYMAFPDGVLDMHPDFRLVATTNPDDNHSIYTGRSKLDFATKDRYHTIPLLRDPLLELHLTSQEVIDEVTIARSILESNSSQRQLTMRDSIRIFKLKALGISESPMEDVVFTDDEILFSEYTTKAKSIVAKQKKASMTQQSATTIDELWDVVSKDAPVITAVDYAMDAAQYSGIDANKSKFTQEYMTSDTEPDTSPSTSNPASTMPEENPSPELFIEILAKFKYTGVTTRGWDIQEGPTDTDPFSTTFKVLYIDTGQSMQVTREALDGYLASK